MTFNGEASLLLNGDAIDAALCNLKVRKGKRYSYLDLVVFTKRTFSKFPINFKNGEEPLTFR